jgi:hypothetical protein
MLRCVVDALAVVAAAPSANAVAAPTAPLPINSRRESIAKPLSRRLAAVTVPVSGAVTPDLEKLR